MTTYEVTAWCSVPYFTIFDVEAGSIGEALEKAKVQAKDEYGEPSDRADWDEFYIVSEGDSDEHVLHLEPPRLAEIAALELLEQLQRGVDHVQSIVDSWERGDLAAAVRDLTLWLPEARATLKKATEHDASEIR
jgi:hypothetical protein